MRLSILVYPVTPPFLDRAQGKNLSLEFLSVHITDAEATAYHVKILHFEVML